MIFGSVSENVNFAKINVSPRQKPLFAGPEPRKFIAKLVEKQHRIKNGKDVAIYLKFHYMLASPEGSGPLFWSSKPIFCQ